MNKDHVFYFIIFILVCVIIGAGFYKVKDSWQYQDEIAKQKAITLGKEQIILDQKLIIAKKQGRLEGVIGARCALSLDEVPEDSKLYGEIAGGEIIGFEEITE